MEYISDLISRVTYHLSLNLQSRFFMHQLQLPWLRHVRSTALARLYGFRCSLPCSIALYSIVAHFPISVLGQVILNCTSDINCAKPFNPDCRAGRLRTDKQYIVLRCPDCIGQSVVICASNGLFVLEHCYHTCSLDYSSGCS